MMLRGRDEPEGERSRTLMLLRGRIEPEGERSRTPSLTGTSH